jgi:hypothetical protein
MLFKMSPAPCGARTGLGKAHRSSADDTRARSIPLVDQDQAVSLADLIARLRAYYRQLMSEAPDRAHRRMAWAALSELDFESDYSFYATHLARFYRLAPATRRERLECDTRRTAEGDNLWAPCYYRASRLNEDGTISVRFLWFSCDPQRELTEAEAKDIFENGAGRWGYFEPFYREDWSPPR